MKVVELWRYPVKSMLGERLDKAQVDLLGIEGDRQRAVVDAESGVSLSAKRYSDLLLCRAWTSNGQVMIGLPDGSEFLADSTEVAGGLSELLDRRVKIGRAGADRTVRHEFPTDLPTGEGEPIVWEPGLEGFFDRAPLHLLTTATLQEFSRGQPESRFERARFRPNLLVDTAEEGFVEEDWVGKDLTVGAVTFQVIDHKPRCVMTTRSQGDLPKDRAVFKTVQKMNHGNAGIELKTQQSGTLNTGDLVSPPP